ncbi:MAG: zf-HC2 domain-containing protein [Terriglobales bacterium]|jgi:hypothetical protein
MADVPKIVHARLRAASCAGRDWPAQSEVPGGAETVAHPEANLLSAFAEQTLSAPEREDVLQHLALCTDCREVVLLALPALDATAAPAVAEGEVVADALAENTRGQKARRGWFGWPSLAWPNPGWAPLRWATLAAGIAVAVLVMRPELQHLLKPNAPVNSASVGTNSVRTNGTENPQVTESAKTLVAKSGAGNEIAPKKAGNSKDISRRVQKTSNASSSAAPIAATANAMNTAPATDATEPNDAAGTAVATAQVAKKATADWETPTSELDLMARVGAPTFEGDAAPIEKAKPAPGESSESPEPSATLKAFTVIGAQPLVTAPGAAQGTTNATPAAATAISRPDAIWMISAGVLQRSLDNGQNWQTLARADRALLCDAVRGVEIWAGGQAGTVMRSTDNGATWAAVAVSSNGQTLSADVTGIELRGPAVVFLSTNNHETWSSTDGGKTWATNGR